MYSRKHWSNEAKKALALYASIASPFGLWPLMRTNAFLHIRLFTGFILVFGTIVVPLREISVRCGTTEDLIDDLIVVASGLLALSKLICYNVHRDKLRANLTSAIDDLSSEQIGTFERIVQNQERTHKLIAYALISQAASSTILYSLKIFVTEPDKWIEVKSERIVSNFSQVVPKRRFLFPSTCTLNDVSDFTYPIIIIMQYLQVLTVCTINTGSDAFFVAMTSHLCGQLEIIGIRFRAIGREVNVSKSRENLSAIVARHGHLLQLATKLEAAYNIIILSQLLVSVMLITVFGFCLLMTLEAKNYVGAIKNVVVIEYILLQTFMYSYVGENLEFESDNIMQSAYDSHWYELPTRVRNDFIFLMMRSNVPLRLTAGKFVGMTKATFMDVMKTSASYLSVMRIMIQE